MRLYYEIAVRAFRRATMYRIAYLAGIVTNSFFGALSCFVYAAVYGASGAHEVAGMRLSETISYAWATQCMISIGAGWIISDIGQTIQTGDVMTDLMRPWSFYGYWLSRTLGERLFNLLFRGSLTYGVGMALFGARIPTTADLAWFVPAVLLAMVISFAFGFLVNLTAFWLIDSSGVLTIANMLLAALSGFLLPLAFLPAPAQTIAAWLPFQAITSTPALILTGKIGGDAALRSLAIQAIWAIALSAMGLALARAALRKTVTQGG